MDFLYRTINSEIQIVGYKGAGGSVVIPSYIAGLPVTSIYDDSFANNSKVTAISIPDSVISIGAGAFSFCVELVTINLGNGVETLGKSAFENCYKLKSISIPNSVTTVGDLVFQKCSGLETATVGTGLVKNIGYGMFYMCEKLENVSLPTNIEKIGDYMFYMCKSLQNFPSMPGATTIGRAAFSNCLSLSNVVIPDAVLSVGDMAFSYCGLTNLTIGSGVTEIPQEFLANSKNISSLIIPNTITKIKHAAFSRCTALNNVIIPNSVTELGGGAFRECSGLTDISIGDSVSVIKSFCFYKCNNLETLICGDGLTEIEDHTVFYECYNLTNLTFEGSAPQIPDYDPAYPPGSNDWRNRNLFRHVPGPVYYHDGTAGWEATFGGLQTVCLDCEYSTSSHSQDSSRGSSISESSSSGGSSQSLLNSSDSSSSVVDARTLPFSIRGISWKTSGSVNGHLAAVTYPLSYKNRISQTIGIFLDNYKLERISLYLGEKRGTNNSYSVHLDIYEADSMGMPSLLIESISKPASEFSNEGWYFFDATSVVRNSPEEKMLCVVFYQDSGDDLNCIPWYYSKNENTGIDAKDICYVSSDEISWEEVPGISMTMKLINSVDMFSEAYSDTAPHRIKTSPGDPATMPVDSDSLSSGIENSHNIKMVLSEQEDTSETSGSDENKDSLNRPYFEIDNPKIITSLVIDGSGSMGWNDRRLGRLEIAKSISDLLLDEYPGEAVLDIVRIGATQVEGLDFTPAEKYGTIKIDINNPERIQANADGSPPSLSDGVVAYGLANLELGNSYVISQIYMGDIVIENGKGIVDQTLNLKIPLNISSFGDPDNSATFQILEEGIGSEKGNGTDALVATLAGATDQIRRNIQVNRHLYVANLIEPAYQGDMALEVDDAGAFKKSQNIAIIDAAGTDPFIKISEITGQTISLSSELNLNFDEKDSALGGFVQEAIVGKYLDLTSGTTLDLLIKDSQATRPVWFYLETSKGGRFEWQITAFKEWESLLLYYSDAGGKISIKGFDNEGKPLPDGTEVQLYVDGPNRDFEIEEDKTTILEIINSPLEEGSDTIFVNDVSSIKKGDSVVLLGADQEDERIDGFLIDSIDEELKKIIIFPPYATSLFGVLSVEISSPIEEGNAENPVFLPISVVNLTPSALNRAANTDTLLIYDPPPTSHLNTDPNAYNQDADYEVRLPMDFPTMWDDVKKKAIVALRALPITDDFVDSKVEKDAKIVAATRELLSDENKALIQALEDDYRIEMENSGQVAEVDVSLDNDGFSTSNQAIPEDADYSIETPVLLFGGETSSFMQTFTEEMEVFDESIMKSLAESYSNFERVENWEYYGLLARKYQIYPYIILKNEYNTPLAIKAVPSFDVYFASPYQILSNIGPSDKKVNFHCQFVIQDPEPGEVSVTEGIVEIPGCYAASEETITIDYLVTYKGALIKDGELFVKFFDDSRTYDQMRDPAITVPDFTAEICAVDQETGLPSFSLKDLRHSFYNRRTGVNQPNYISSVTDKPEATYIDGYYGTITVPIVNGKGSVSIKAPSTIVAKIQVLAEFVFPEDSKQSVIKPDPIWFVNPLEIAYYGSDKLTSGLDQPLYEIGALVFYKGEPVLDNVPVNFKSASHPRFLPGQGNVIPAGDPLARNLNAFIDGLSPAGELPGAGAIGTALDQLNDAFAKYGYWPPTQLSPSVSKTINGVARAVYLGPHGEVVNHFNSETLEQEGDEEKITISTSYSGFSVTLVKTIEWMGIDEFKDFKFRIKTFDENGNELTSFTTPLYADGWSSVYILADLAASVTMYPSVNPYVDILLGKDEFGNPVGTGKPSWVLFSGAGNGFWQEQRPLLGGRLIGDDITIDGGVGRGYCLSNPINKSARIIKQKCDCTYAGACGDNGTLIDVNTSATVGTERFKGLGCMCQRDWNNDCENLVPCGNSFITWPTRPAAIMWEEPLKGEISCFGKQTFKVNRDGKPTDIWVNITFSGEAIPIVSKRHNVTDAAGNEPGMPLVVFDIYKIVEEKAPNGLVIRRSEIRDDTLSLTSYSEPLVVNFTEPDSFGGGGHFHRCQVDGDGNGSTVAEYQYGTGLDRTVTHTHTISKFQIADSVDSEGTAHSHRIMSAVRTTINPTNDIVNKICLSARFSYDASKKPVERKITETVCDDGKDPESGWFLEVFSAGNYDAQEGTTTTDDGVDVIAEISHIVDGEPVLIPEDTRIHLDVGVFLNQEDDTGSFRKTVVFSESGERPYVILEWKATIKVDESTTVEATTRTLVNSKFSWIPNVRTLVPEITSDRIYIDKALSSITTLGGSPMHDAIYLAASRVISYRIENNDSDSYACMVVITDGDENLSDKSLDQGIKSVGRMALNSSAAPVAIGRPHPADALVLRKYADETKGIIIRAADKVIDGPAIAKKIFADKLEEANSGTYKNSIDLSSQKLFKSTTIDITFPTDSSATFRARFGEDGKNWGDWSQSVKIPTSGFVNIEILSDGKPHRFMDYEISLFGNQYFESPRLISFEISYIEPKKHTIFFSPISVDTGSEEYIGEVLITHKISESENSTIQYGMVQADSLDEIEYFGAGQPLTGTATRNILLGRHNELALSTDRTNFKMVNGPWPKMSGIEVYKITGETIEFVSPSLYSANPANGSISFTSLQNEDTKLSVTVQYPPSISLVCLITNYGLEALSIDHIGVTYNKTQRIGKDEYGINRKPISDIYEISSSSSESSDTELLK